MTTTERRPAKFRAPHVMPRAGSRDGTAPLRSDPAQVLHQVLFIAGVVLLPAGLIVIGFGWYGAAHTPYAYDQMSYLVSAVFGLGMTFVGGFLYFGSWLARIGGEQKESQRQLSDTVLRLASSVAGSSAMSNGVVLEDAKRGQVRAVVRKRDPGAVLVVAGRGSTLHRADCSLISSREDLRPVGADTDGLTPCRLCQGEATK
ncbi:hypothetical protein GCM10022234_17410 [Aeromicrobium panaciterrae]|uniref:hypothetical protein n=1 Tax=Aeromicrobium panaciterrae TaxID=363861 RepID=UPI0031E3D178